MIRRAVGGKGDAIVVFGSLARDQPVRHIERDLCGITAGWVAEAADGTPDQAATAQLRETKGERIGAL